MMSEKTQLMVVAYAVNTAIGEAEKIPCHCNKFTEHVCVRCTLIKSLDVKMHEIIESACLTQKDE